MSDFEKFEQLASRARVESVPEIDVVDSVMDQIAGKARAARSGSITSRLQSRGVRWTVAAAVCFVAMWFGMPGQSEADQALAVVRKARESLSVKSDRTYEITVEGRSPTGEKRQRHAKLYARGTDAFVLQFPGPFGSQLLAGSDGQTSWFIPPIGPVLVDDGTELVDRLLNDQRTPIPVLRLDEILDRLERDYELSLTPEKSDWTHITGRKRSSEMHRPETVNLWTDPASGILDRLELDWGDDLKRPGPHSISVKLASQEPLGAGFFQHGHHHAPDRPVRSPVDE